MKLKICENLRITSASTSSVAREGPSPGDTILGWHHLEWNHIIMQNHNSTDLWWRPCFSFYFVSNLIWTKNPVILRRRPFFSFFFGGRWSSPSYGPKGVTLRHGRRSSKWFGEAPKFCPKNDLKVAWQIICFFCPKWGDLQQKKKRSALKLSRFFCPNCGDLQKKKKRSSLTLRRFFYPAFGKFYAANLPKQHEIAQNFDAILPKRYKIAQNFARNLDTLHQPGGPVPLRPSHLLCLCTT